MRWLPYLFLGVLGIAISSCKRHQSAEHSFYYWKTSFPYHYNDTGYVSQIHALGIQHFYLRYLDIDWSENLNMPVPVAQLTNDRYASAAFINGKYTPVIFLTNRTFQRITDAWCDSLAVRVVRKVTEKTQQLEQSAEDAAYWKTSFTDNYRWEHQDSIRNAIRQGRKNRCDEIQIDCDWTAATKDKYFRFLSRLKRFYPQKKIAVTIRLYPYKYQDKMGVPPVDKGLLMCYNLSDIKSTATRNSVFDLKELKQYLTKDYPLPMDVALPVFGWQAWFRNDQFQGILYDRNGEQFSDTLIFSKQNEQYTRVMQDQVIGNNYLREGDVLRTEYPDEKDLETAADLLRDEFPEAARIAFYYWDLQNINRYENTIRQIYHRW